MSKLSIAIPAGSTRFCTRPGRRCFRKGGDRRTRQIHAFQFDNLEDIERRLAVRDYPRAHRDVAETHGNLQARLAGRFSTDIEGHSDGKHDFMIELEREALRRRHRERS